MMITSSDIYEPQEDSYLLQKSVRQLAFGRVLDMGTGSGIQALTAAEIPRVREFVAVDINPVAVEELKQKQIRKMTVRQGDLFEPVDGQFTVIIFNPPYLPQDKGIEDCVLYGGKKGWEIAERFFRDASRYLLPDGKILFLFSTLTNKQKIEEIGGRYLFSFQEIDRQKLAFEELFVYEITKTPLLRRLEARGIEHLTYHAQGKRGMIYKGRINLNQKIKSFIPSRSNYVDVAVKVKKETSEAKETIPRESSWLERANHRGICPKLLLATEEFVVTKFISGDYLLEWLETHSGPEGVAVLHQLLDQCFLLDQGKISKEEMHHPYKHIIVTPFRKPVMIDFERCHATEKPQNVTQFIEHICRLKPVLEKKGATIDIVLLREAAKEYKEGYASDSFKKIIKLVSS